MRASLVAAGLFAVCDFHIAYSRSWLLDAGFCFLFALSMYCLIRLFETAATWWAVAAGLAAGLAWNTKYNGWMPLAIAATSWLIATLLGSWQTAGAARQHAQRTLFLLVAASLLAMVLFAPWYLYVERHFPGGFQRVNEHHRSFMGVVTAWTNPQGDMSPLSAAAQQWVANGARLLRELPAYRHWGWCLFLVASVGAAMVAMYRRATRQACAKTDGFSGLSLLTVSGISVACLGGAGFLLPAAAVIGVHLLIHRRTSPVEYLIVVWLGAFLVLVPAYEAYSRLLVPAMPAAAVLVACRWPGFQRREATHPIPNFANLAKRRAVCLSTLLVLAAVASFAGRWSLDELRGVWRCWSAHDSYRGLASLLAERTPRNAVILCHTQPILWFQIDRPYVDPLDQPLPSPAEVRPYYIAVDGEIHTRPRAKASFLEHADRIIEVARVPNNVTPPALFNLPVVSSRVYWRKMRELGRDPQARLIWHEPNWRRPASRAAVLPPSMDRPQQDWIILYYVTRF